MKTLHRGGHAAEFADYSLGHGVTGDWDAVKSAPTGTGVSNLSLLYVHDDAFDDLEGLLFIHDAGALSHAPIHVSGDFSWGPVRDALVRVIGHGVPDVAEPGVAAAEVGPIVIDLVQTAVKTPAEITQDVIDGFALTKTQLASIVGVSRQSVHGWLRGAQELGRASHEQLTALDHLLQALTNAGIERPDIALTCPLFRDRASAADMIRDGQWIEDSHTTFLIEQMSQRRTRSASSDADSSRAMRELERQGRFLSRDE